jgi:hypothetical protein
MRNVLIQVSFIVTSHLALAQVSEKIEGVVRVAGGGLSQEIQLLGEGDEKSTVLCENDLVFRIKKLAAMTIQVNGSWVQLKQSPKKCFSASEFRVLKHISGREALVGILSKSKNTYAVKGDDGKDHLISEVPAGLAKLEGKKVILDVMSITTSSKKSLKVVSYGEYP